ncbi:MAG: hypothetical protein R3183_03570 [Oleiphilaceae bacterium]|nr:hypothetical protein [Oleiphilaceae bacterium]
MNQPAPNLSDTLEGLNQLVNEGIVGVNDVVEAMHKTIANRSLLSPRRDTHVTPLLPGLAYASVRTITRLVGQSIDVPLKLARPYMQHKQLPDAWQHLISALNGVLGDHLVAQQNPLAIPMGFYRDGKAFEIDALRAELKQKQGKLLLLVHGLCMNDIAWQRQGHDHGQALAEALGYVPIYLRYNSGRHISENGRELSLQLERLLTDLDLPVELSILCHSMGGLVTRSACHVAKNASEQGDTHGGTANWRAHLKHLVFLGSPHHGAPLERIGNIIDRLLIATPYSAPLSKLGKVRSAGVTDLRYGYLLDEDWQHSDRFDKHNPAQRTPVPLPRDVACYTVATTTASQGKPDLLGDGLVPLNSALGRHKDARFNLEFAEEHCWTGYGIHHLDLLNHPEVLQALMAWLK